VCISDKLIRENGVVASSVPVERSIRLMPAKKLVKCELLLKSDSGSVTDCCELLLKAKFAKDC